MMIGYNNDVEHRGKTFHIQTEDRGANDDTIETQLFCGGAILDTKITTYTDLIEGLEGKERDRKVKAIMKASHKSLFNNLMAGKYDEMVGLEPLDGEVEVDAEAFQPGQDRVPQEALAIEEGQVEDLGTPGGDHVGLSQLKDKLATLKEKSPAEEDLSEESEGPATEVVSPPPDMRKRMDSQNLKARLARNLAPQPTQVDYASTGKLAWSGCEEPEEDLSLTEMVQGFLAS